MPPLHKTNSTKHQQRAMLVEWNRIKRATKRQIKARRLPAQSAVASELWLSALKEIRDASKRLKQPVPADVEGFEAHIKRLKHRAELLAQISTCKLELATAKRLGKGIEAANCADRLEDLRAALIAHPPLTERGLPRTPRSRR